MLIFFKKGSSRRAGTLRSPPDWSKLSGASIKGGGFRQIEQACNSERRDR
jgi:hypothetical protein